MKYNITQFFKKNNLEFEKYFNCYCAITKKHENITEITKKSPYKIIFQNESVVFLRINSPYPKEYHFGYEHIIEQSFENNILKLIVKDFHYKEMYFEFEFLFVFDKYLLDPFSIKKEDLQSLLEKHIYIDYSESWYDERKEIKGILKRVGDLRIGLEDMNNQMQEVEIFDINYFFAKL